MQIRAKHPAMRQVRWSEVPDGAIFLSFYGDKKFPKASDWFVKISSHDLVPAAQWGYFSSRLPQYGLSVPLSDEDVRRIHQSIPELSALVHVFSDSTYKKGRFALGEEVPTAGPSEGGGNV